MKRAVTVLLVILPTLACAEGSPGQDFSFISSFLQMIAALSIVVGLILLTKHVMDNYLNGIAPSRRVPRHIRVVETRYLAPKKNLILVEVGGEYLLLSSSGDNLSLIKKIDMIEEIEVVEEIGDTRSGLMARLLSRYKGTGKG